MSGERLPVTPELELELDVRLRTLWESCDDAGYLLSPFGASVIRAAYGLGYMDALREPVRGELCLEHGYPVPERAPAATPSRRPASPGARDDGRQL